MVTNKVNAELPVSQTGNTGNMGTTGSTVNRDSGRNGGSDSSFSDMLGNVTAENRKQPGVSGSSVKNGREFSEDQGSAQTDFEGGFRYTEKASERTVPADSTLQDVRYLQEQQDSKQAPMLFVKTEKGTFSEEAVDMVLTEAAETVTQQVRDSGISPRSKENAAEMMLGVLKGMRAIEDVRFDGLAVKPEDPTLAGDENIDGLLEVLMRVMTGIADGTEDEMSVAAFPMTDNSEFEDITAKLMPNELPAPVAVKHDEAAMITGLMPDDSDNGDSSAEFMVPAQTDVRLQPDSIPRFTVKPGQLTELTGEDMPDIPDMTDTAVMPDMPVMKDIPETAEMPYIPDMPAKPEQPDIPVTAETTDTPAAADAPEIPEAPDKPVSRDIPDTSDDSDTKKDTKAKDTAVTDKNAAMPIRAAEAAPEAVVMQTAAAAETAAPVMTADRPDAPANDVQADVTAEIPVRTPTGYTPAADADLFDEASDNMPDFGESEMFEDLFAAAQLINRTNRRDTSSKEGAEAVRDTVKLLGEIIDDAKKELGLTEIKVAVVADRTEESADLTQYMHDDHVKLSRQLSGRDSTSELDHIMGRQEDTADETGTGRSSAPKSGTYDTARMASELMSGTARLDTPPRTEFEFMSDPRTVRPPEVQLTEQILQRIENMQDDHTEFTMVLNPESLGRITVKLVMAGEKTAVEVTAENPGTRELLAARSEALQNMLKQNGVELERYQVVTEQEDSQFRQQSYDGSSKNPYGRNDEERRQNDGSSDDDDSSGDNFYDLMRSM